MRRSPPFAGRWRSSRSLTGASSEGILRVRCQGWGVKARYGPGNPQGWQSQFNNPVRRDGNVEDVLNNLAGRIYKSQFNNPVRRDGNYKRVPALIETCLSHNSIIPFAGMETKSH